MDLRYTLCQRQVFNRGGGGRGADLLDDIECFCCFSANGDTSERRRTGDNRVEGGIVCKDFYIYRFLVSYV